MFLKSEYRVEQMNPRIHCNGMLAKTCEKDIVVSKLFPLLDKSISFLGVYMPRLLF